MEKDIYNINEDNLDIKMAIVRTVAYFDLFEYPLTSFEIWKFLGPEGKNKSLEEIRKILEDGIDEIKLKNGYYYLVGREEIINLRLERYSYAKSKFKKGVKISKIFKLIPWIKMIALSNLLGSSNAKKDSDIDLFIISEDGKIWLTRFFSVLIIKFLNLRPKENDKKDKICLSFFITESNSNLEYLMLKNEDGEYDDPHFLYWLANFYPLYNRNEFEKFIQANSFIKYYLPNINFTENKEWQGAGKPLNKFYYRIINLFFVKFEKILKNFQLKKFPKTIKEKMNKNTNVVINDKILKLHVNDRRREYNEKYINRLKTLFKDLK